MNISKMKASKKQWIQIAIIFIGSLAIFYWKEQISEIISLLGNRDAIVAFLEPYGVLGPLVLFVVLMMQVFLAVIPGHAFIVAGGYIYGLFWGTVLTQLSTVIASQLAFILVRRYGRPFVDRIAPKQIVDQWNLVADKQGALFYFFGFILPIFPNDLMAFIAGLSSISPKDFLIANFFGRLPVAILITLIGSHGFEMPIHFWVLMVLLVLGLSFGWKYISPLVEKRLFSKTSPTKCVC